MTFNSALADRVLGYIEANPEKHNQVHWIAAPAGNILHMPKDTPVAECGTTACMAGWTVILQEQLALRDLYWDEASNAMLAYGDRMLEDSEYFGQSIQATARRLLDLTFEQAEELFDSRNTLADLKEMCKAYANEEGALLNPRRDFNSVSINAYGHHLQRLLSEMRLQPDDSLDGNLPPF